MTLPTVASLTAALGPDLHPAAGFEAPEHEISAVHISELPDPVGYLAGGELLLTTGLSLPAGRLGCDRYVERLAGVGISALGFGLGPVLPTTPPRLSEACRRHGVTLLEVPERTPFLTVTEAYWSARSRTSQRQLDDAVSAQRALVAEAVSEHPVEAVLKLLSRTLEGWAALLDPLGRVEELYPATAAEASEAVAAELRERGNLGPHTASTFPAGDGSVVVFPLSLGEVPLGHLAVGQAQRLDATQRRIVLTAVALLTMIAATRRRARDEIGGVDRAVLELLDLKLPDAARRLSSRIGSWPLPEKVRVLAVRSGRAAEVQSAVTDWAGHALTGELGADRAWFVVPADPPPLDRLATELAHADADSAALVSPPTTLDSVRDVRLRLVEQLAATADGRRPRDVVPLPGEEDLRRRLAPILEQPLLVEALALYLRHRGQWEPAARAGGLHRNTLRYRVTRCREMTDLDLDDADVAAPLWLLLRGDGRA